MVDTAPSARGRTTRGRTGTRGRTSTGHGPTRVPELADRAPDSDMAGASHRTVALAGPGTDRVRTHRAARPRGRIAPPIASHHAVSQSISAGSAPTSQHPALVPGVTWIAAAPTPLPERRDCRVIEDFTSARGWADVVHKPGYGILVEAMLGGTGSCGWTGAPSEAAHLAKAMTGRGDRRVPARPSDRARFRRTLADTVRARLDDPRPARIAGSSARALAQRVMATPPRSR